MKEQKQGRCGGLGGIEKVHEGLLEFYSTQIECVFMPFVRTVSLNSLTLLGWMCVGEGADEASQGSQDSGAHQNRRRDIRAAHTSASLPFACPHPEGAA